jgi:tRNA(fMet)-specific endonuclease VapC
VTAISHTGRAMPDDALVDTDVASTLYRAQLFTERGPVVVVTAIHDRNLFVSVVTLGEALYGATRRKWSAQRTARLRDFYPARFAVVPVDSEVAVEYARLRSATEGLGRPVADNDVWIAASATANGLSIVTLNRRHFEPLTLHGLTLL